MVSKSSAILLIVAVFAFQGTNANIIDDIIAKISQSMNNTITEIKEKVAEMEVDAKKMMDDMKTKIQEAEKKAKETIEADIAKAKQLNIDISECDTAAKEAIENVKNSSESAMSKCWSTEEEAMKPDTDVMKDDMDLFQSMASQAAKNFSACGWNLSCHAKVVLEASKQGTDIINKTAKDAIKFTSDVGPAIKEFNSCAREDMKSAASSIQDIYKQEAQCIKDKINNARSQ